MGRKGQTMPKKIKIKLTNRNTQEVKCFDSYAAAAEWAQVSREAVRTWADGIYNSRNFSVEKI